MSFNSKAFLKTLTTQPGVYQMVDTTGIVIYVGKAKNLKNRVANYFQKTSEFSKKTLMVAKIAEINITVTDTEGEALLLENHLIKKLHPRYNILLRDDKSYPYLFLSKHQYPRIAFHRGAKNKKGQYFGPYPSAGAVKQTLKLLQKLFPVRQCEDSFFQNRSRACLQHQIDLCSAPCVGLISTEQYQVDVEHTIKILQGKSQIVAENLVKSMELAANALAFEEAARFRDQITNLRRVQEKQYISGERGDVDIIACIVDRGIACCQVFFIRSGQNLGNKTYYPKLPKIDCDEKGILDAFVSQYYINKPVPHEILLSHEIENKELLQNVLKEQVGYVVTISFNLRSDRAKWMKLAVKNAHYGIETQINSEKGVNSRFQALEEGLKLSRKINRMECFDISHTMGEATVASCVVFDRNGAKKSDYRLFNIKGVTAGDDYHAMEQALIRRYRRLVKGEGVIPDILFIDGGKGQLGIAEKVIEEFQIKDLLLVGIAKGVERKPGKETLFVSPGNNIIEFDEKSPALHLIQQIRDEAHRFAITGHRNQRQKKRNKSVLETIEGLGSVRRQKLLNAFGGIQAIERAGVEDIAKVNGISLVLAKRVYDQFRE